MNTKQFILWGLLVSFVASLAALCVAYVIANKQVNDKLNGNPLLRLLN